MRYPYTDQNHYFPINIVINASCISFVNALCLTSPSPSILYTFSPRATLRSYSAVCSFNIFLNASSSVSSSSSFIFIIDWSSCTSSSSSFLFLVVQFAASCSPSSCIISVVDSHWTKFYPKFHLKVHRIFAYLPFHALSCVFSQHRFSLSCSRSYSTLACVFPLLLFCVSHRVFEDGLPLLTVGYSKVWIDLKTNLFIH